MKLERLISMIYMLLNNEVISASALAEKYQVSQRTIYRDIDAICAAGIPVVSYQGVHGGYGIMESYKMDKSLLGSYDVETLITMLNSLSGIFMDEKAQDTVRKLRTIDKDRSNPSVMLDIGTRSAPSDLLRQLRSAIKGQRVVYMEYISLKNERTYRTVEPVCLMYKTYSWYLYAYCRSRKDYREFRLTRISDLKLLPEQYTQQHAMPDQSEDRYSNEYWKGQSNPSDVVLRFSPRVIAIALDRFNQQEKQFNPDGSLNVCVHLHSSDETNWLIPIILSFGDDVEVLEPDTLRDQIKAKIEGMLKTYNHSSVM